MDDPRPAENQPDPDDSDADEVSKAMVSGEDEYFVIADGSSFLHPIVDPSRAEDPVEQPTDAFADDAVEQPTAAYTNDPLEQPTDAFADDAVEQPTAAYTSNPLEQPTDAYASDAVEQPTDAQEIKEASPPGRGLTAASSGHFPGSPTLSTDTYLPSSEPRLSARSATQRPLLSPEGKRGPLSGAEWPDYRIGDLLGQGAMATVYLAERCLDGLLVALKVLPGHHAEDPVFRRRLELEAEAAGSIDNAHVAGVYKAGKYGDTYFLEMELIEGGTL